MSCFFFFLENVIKVETEPVLRLSLPRFQPSYQLAGAVTASTDSPSPQLPTFLRNARPSVTRTETLPTKLKQALVQNSQIRHVHALSDSGVYDE